MQEEIINTYFKIVPPRDEVWKNDVDISLKMFLSHEDILEEEDDTINTFLNVNLPFIHGIPPRDEVLMDIVNYSPKFCASSIKISCIKRIKSLSFSLLTLEMNP